MNWFKEWWARKRLPVHQERGVRGENAARLYLENLGCKHLASNYRSRRGEIDLVFRDGELLIFVEVKTRSSERFNRPARAVDREKQRRISKTAFDYLREIGSPKIPIRFDIVEVLLDGEIISEIRHLANAFPLSHPRRYG
jgi:putative endonuclease